MLEAKITTKFKLPNLNFTKVLKGIADKVIMPDIRLGINRSIGIDGAPFPALEASTIKMKSGARKKAAKLGGLKKSGAAGARGGSQPLVDTGELRDNSIFSQEVATNHVRISIGSSRAKIAYFLQVVGVGHKRKQFNFFGISQRAEFQAISKMKEALKGSLAKINGK